MKIIDISPSIHSKLAVFPGDTPWKRTIALDFAKGDHLLLSQMQATLHLGAHADAPSHYHPDGEGIDTRSLDYYLGPCQVIDLSQHNYSSSDWKINLGIFNLNIIQTPRVLFKTLTFDPYQWKTPFASFDHQLISKLKQLGVITLGIDTPSVDAWNSKDLETHNAIFKNDMAILEGLDLAHTSEGLYRLIALPLKIQAGDASPVRAILLEGSHDF